MGEIVMNTIQEKDTKTLLREALKMAQSYETYRNRVHELALAGATTGPDQTESLINYTQLNDRRMKRWDKTLRLDDKSVETVKELRTKVTWLVLTESWCGDASPSLPVMNKLAVLGPYLDLKIALRDEHPELMDRFLTNGARSIPKLLALDSDTLEVIGEWGPRSSKATGMVHAYKAEHGKLTPEFKQDLQVFYNKDKGADILNDLLELLTLK